MKYRAEIDGLRAFAVLSVVIFHAFPTWLQGGFIGVDVFFVISGYLITRIIFEELDGESFSFSGFMGRRIRRIFPALILVGFVSLACGWFVLLADEYAQLGKHVASGAAFIVNFILVDEAGYFDNAADTKPMLHLWSLAVEEQFYIVWPFVLWLCWKLKINLLLPTVLIALLSLGFNLAFIDVKPIETFFWPISRFWELLSGSILAWLTLYRSSWISTVKIGIDQRLSNLSLINKRDDGAVSSDIMATTGLTVLLFGVIGIHEELAFPGVWAVIPVVGTLLVIVAGSQGWLNRVLFMHPAMVAIGLISYPLYLWHWPVLSFLRIVEGGTPQIDTRFLAVLASVLLAAMTYWLVEKPIRFGGKVKYKTAGLAALMVVMGALGLTVYTGDLNQQRSIVQVYKGFNEQLAWDNWYDEACGEEYSINPCQVSGEDIQVMILGDSHGNHLYPGLVETLPQDVGVFSGGTCPPLSNVVLSVSKNQDKHPCKSENYLEKNFSILNSTPSVETVVLSSFWRPVLTLEILNEKERDYWGSMHLESSIAEEKDGTPFELTFAGLRRTIDRLRAENKNVVFVRDTPDFTAHIKDICLVNRMALLQDNVTIECSIQRIEFEKRRTEEDKLVSRLAEEFPNLLIFDPIDVFCGETICELTRNGVPLFRDQHHLSVYGSRILAQEIVRVFPQAF